MAEQSDFEKVLNEHFFYRDSFRELCEKLKTVDGLLYVAFLRDFVFQLVSPEPSKRRFRSKNAIVKDLNRGERILKRLHRDLPVEFYQKCMEHLIVFFPKCRDILLSLREPSSFKDIFNPSGSQISAPWKDSYEMPLVAWRAVFARVPPARAWQQAIADASNYLGKRDRKRGRRERRQIKLMSVALSQLMRKNTGKPCYSLVENTLNQHFKLRVGKGYIRQFRPSKNEKKILHQLSVVFQNRHRLHPSLFEP